MRLLFLTNNLCGGGAERVLVNLVNGLAERGHDVTVRLLVNERANRKSLDRNVKLEYIFKRSFRGLNYLHMAPIPRKKLYNFVCHGEFDVVIPYLQGVLTKICSFAPPNQKRVAWLHGEAKIDSKLFRIGGKHNELQRYFVNYDRVICVSRRVMETFCELSTIHSNVEVLYNALDLDWINQMKDKDSCTISKDKILICYVGHFHSLNGIKRLINISHRLSQSGLDNRLLVLGNGDEMNEDLAYAESLNVDLMAPGFVDNPYAYLKKANIYVDASYTAGLSTALIEALASGVPCVTADVPGARDILGDNSEYGIVADNTEEDIYIAVKTLLSDKEMLAYYKSVAPLGARRFSKEETIGAVEKMLEKVISQG